MRSLGIFLVVWGAVVLLARAGFRPFLVEPPELLDPSELKAIADKEEELF